MDARMTTAELIALIELQEGPRGAIEESCCRWLGASCGANDARWASLGCHARGQCNNLRFGRPCGNGGNGIRNYTSGAFYGGVRKVVERGINDELAYLIEVICHRFHPK